MKYLLKKPGHTIYLDHAATTYVDQRVVKAMQPYWSDDFGNPSSLYKAGKDAKEAISNSRTTIANLLNCKPQEILFTSGGTESINTAIFGVARQYELKNRKKGHLIATTIEHHAVLHSIKALVEEGWQADFAPVDSEGFVKLEDLKNLVRKDTVLISVMYANNEIGSVQEITEIGKWLTGLNKNRQANGLPQIVFHTDACQAGGSLSLDVENLHVDLMSLNGSKVYGPKGIGLLYIRSGIKIRPLIFGGGQENDLRSGTENVPAIVGMAKALEIAQEEMEKENKRLIDLSNYFDDRLSKEVSDISLNGPKTFYSEDRNPNKVENNLRRLPNNINFTFKNVEGEALMFYLDAHDIAVATGSACTTTSGDPSHVLEAIGLSPEVAKQSIRITMGRKTNKKDLDHVVDVLGRLVPELRKTYQA